jgi:hypothetical protein
LLKLFLSIYLIFDQKYSCQAKYLAGYRYPALTGYPAGYPVSGFWISRISGIRLLDKPDIRPTGYPTKTVSGASLYFLSNLNVVVKC